VQLRVVNLAFILLCLIGLVAATQSTWVGVIVLTLPVLSLSLLLLLLTLLLLIQLLLLLLLTLLQAALPSLLPIELRLHYLVPQLQVPVELVVFHLGMLAFLERFKDGIGRSQHHWLVKWCARLGLTRFLLPLPITARSIRLVVDTKVLATATAIADASTGSLVVAGDAPSASSDSSAVRNRLPSVTVARNSRWGGLDGSDEEVSVTNNRICVV
jgi:hypothetical protein